MKHKTPLIYNNSMKPRKDLPKTALPRIYFIDQKIASGKYPTAPSLAREYETSISTIYRDIEFMRVMMGAPIEYDFFMKGYYYTKKTFRLSAALATADDLLALGMVKSLVDLYRDTPVYDAALKLMETATLPLQGEENTEWYKDRIIVPKSVTVPVDPKIWKNVVMGLKENRIIKFTYKGNENSVKWRRRVHPYQLLFDRSAWYLSGFAEDRKDRRMFALSRMSNVIVTNDTFTIKGGFDYRAVAAESYFGVFVGGKTYKYEIEITGDVRWIKERKWAKDQKIQEIPNGIKLSFTSNQFDRILDWILSFGANARPLSPKVLVDRWKAVVRDMAKLANKK